MKIKWSILLIIFWVSAAHAEAEFGVGYNNATGGRIVPSLNVGFGSSSFEVLASSTGVATKAYSHSAYSLGGYWTKTMGVLISGKVVSGYGFGAIYAVRNFKDLNTQEETKTDLAFGPAFFSRWYFWDPVFFSVEAILGIGDASKHLGDMLGMNARDQVNFCFGVHL